MAEHTKRYLGQQVGHYRLTRWLGKGGFADVYLGEHIYLKTQNAIKMLHVQLSEKAFDDFLHEAQTIAGLDHPNIVRVLDYGIEEDVPYLVMNYAPNGSIRLLIPRKTYVPPEGILPTVQQLASALDYAHARKLIHRDVKPENILIGEHGQALLSDFGLVIVAQSSSSQLDQKTSGTIPYTAPEQLQGRACFASDQYSLGITTYEWLCGARPFSGTFVDIASQHIFTPPPPLRQRVPGLSPLIEQVVFKALAKDPEQRYESVTDFANALRDACQQAANFSRSPSISTETLTPEAHVTTPLTSPGSVHALLQTGSPVDQVVSQTQQPEVTPHAQVTAPSHSGPATSQTQQAGVVPLPPVTQTPSTQPPFVGTIIPPQESAVQAPLRRSSVRRAMLWRTVLLVLLLVLIAGGTGLWLWYGMSHSSARKPGQGQTTGQALATSTAQVAAQKTAGTTRTTPAGTAVTGAAPGTGNTPVSATATTGASTHPTSTPTHAPGQTPTAAPDCLRGSSSHLTFTSLLGLGNPSPQGVTLTNCGGNTQSWTASLATNSGGGWLSASPSTGTTAANGSVNIQVQAAGAGLQLGIYTGSLTLRKGSAIWRITVTYTIVQA